MRGPRDRPYLARATGRHAITVWTWAITLPFALTVMSGVQYVSDTQPYLATLSVAAVEHLGVGLLLLAGLGGPRSPAASRRRRPARGARRARLPAVRGDRRRPPLPVPRIRRGARHPGRAGRPRGARRDQRRHQRRDVLVDRGRRGPGERPSRRHPQAHGGPSRARQRRGGRRPPHPCAPALQRGCGPRPDRRPGGLRAERRHRSRAGCDPPPHTRRRGRAAGEPPAVRRGR